MPTAAHVSPGWLMAYDLEPMKAMAAKRHWLPELAAGDWLCIFEHDPVTPLGKIVEQRPGRYEAVDATTD